MRHWQVTFRSYSTRLEILSGIWDFLEHKHIILLSKAHKLLTESETNVDMYLHMTPIMNILPSSYYSYASFSAIVVNVTR